MTTQHKTPDSLPIVSFEGTLEEESTANLRDILPEECALAAAIGLPNASRIVYDCLMLQEHRGEHSVGIISVEDDNFSMRRRVGSVKEQFLEVDFASQLPGHTAIGHNRYATKGDPHSITNIQPLFFHHSRHGSFAIAHNGTLADRDGLRDTLAQEGVLFQSTMDSEVLGHLIARSDTKTLEEAVKMAVAHIPTAYAMLVFSKDKVIALRDRYGVRPLSIATMEDGYLICSENFTFDQYPNCLHLEDISPGEMVVFDLDNVHAGFQRHQLAEPDEHFCIFEGIYFSDPRTRYNGYWHEDFRFELGKRIFDENPDIEGDVIIPVLDSGKHAALGLSEASGIPYQELFQRLHNPPRSNRRSFTSATYEERVRTAHQKLHLRKEKIKGRRVVIVDDSIVRSTTIRIINQRLREAGATHITICISAPAIVNVCPYGMDFQERSQLVAYAHSVEEIRKKIGADRLIYVSLDGLDQVVQETYQCGTCSGCFGGRYPVFGEEGPE